MSGRLWWGTCSACGEDITLTMYGRLWTHGPRNNRCGGSGDFPINTLAAAVSDETGSPE